MGRHKKQKYKLKQKIGTGKIIYIRYEKGWRYYINFLGNILFDSWITEEEVTKRLKRKN